MIYTSTDGQSVFKILREANGWVYYINVHTGQEYSCLKEAFLARFHAHVN